MVNAGTTLETVSPKTQLGIPVDRIVWFLIALFVVNNWLLLAFLGQALSGVAAGVLSAGIGLLVLSARPVPMATDQRYVSLPVLGCCFVIAVTLLILGGEGRFLYANADWQVRDAVLYDMTKNPWPFSYLVNNQELILRAPLGMYLLPASLAKGFEGNVDLFLLGSNAVVLTLLLAGASALFETRQHRLIALVTFLAFSGLDSIGSYISAVQGKYPSADHLEFWAGKLQYSSTITLIYWVPPHAFAGWACALTIILYLKQQVRLGLVMATIFLVAIWSPLAIMGAAPFAGWIGVKALLKREIRLADLLIGVLALIVSLPALAFLTSGSQSLHQGLHLPDNVWLFLFMEVGVWAILLAALGGAFNLGKDIFALTLLLLCAIPFGQLGTGIDFQMRASITPLAVLSFLVAMSLCESLGRSSLLRIALIFGLLAASSITALTETQRSFRYQASPPPLCNLPQVWTKQSGRIAELETYTTSPAELPQWLQPAQWARKVDEAAPSQCWSRQWFTPQ